MEDTGVVNAPSASERCRDVADWMLIMSWLWLVPLLFMTGAVAFFSLMFVGFVAEALDGDVTPLVVLTTIGPAAVMFFLPCAAGLVTGRFFARRIGRAASLSKVWAWVLGLGSTVVAGATAALALYVTYQSLVWVYSALFG